MMNRRIILDVHGKGKVQTVGLKASAVFIT